MDEYILIGEADDGTCGDNWETWGNPTFLPDASEMDDQQTNKSEETKEAGPSRQSDNLLPPHAVDGYDRWDMDTLCKYQFSRFDCAVSRSSKTVSFRKASP